MRAWSVLKLSSLLPLLPLIFVACGSGSGDTPAAVTPPPLAAQPDMLTATAQGLMRGKASGEGQHLIFDRPNLDQHAFFGVVLAHGLVYYPQEAPVFDLPNRDIWSVQADGAGDHAALNTTADEFLVSSVGPVVIAQSQRGTPANGDERTDYLSLRDGVPTLLPIHEPLTRYYFPRGETAYFSN